MAEQQFVEGVAAGVAAVLRSLVEAGGQHLVDELRARGVDVGRLAPTRPLRVLGPVDLDADDVPELREVGQVEPAPRPKLLDATAYLAMLDEVRREVQGETPMAARYLVDSARLNARGARGSEAHQALLEAIAEHGWDAIRELLRWGWREVAAGRRKPVLQATVLSAGGIGAMLEAHGRAQQAERERLAAEDLERERARRDAEERHGSAGGPVSEYASKLLAGLGLADGGAAGGAT